MVCVHVSVLQEMSVATYVRVTVYAVPQTAVVAIDSCMALRPQLSESTTSNSTNSIHSSATYPRGVPKKL